MDLEHKHLLINRAIDGVASAAEREELARTLKSDPLLRSEFEEHEAAHMATGAMFRQLALPEDFSKRVMRRIQGVEVPADDTTEVVRLPSQRPLQGREAKVISIHRRRARVYALVAFMSAAAALILALGVITGAFSNNVAPTDTDDQTNEKTAAEGSRGVPDTGNPKPHRDSHPQPLPDDGEAPKGDTPKDDGSKPVVPEKVPGPQPEVDDGSKGPDSEPKQPVKVPDDQPSEPVEPDDVVEKPAPGVTPDDVVEEKPEPETEPDGPEGTAVVEREVLGRMLVLSGQVHLVGADGTLTRLEEDQAIHAGDRIRTKYNAVVMLQLGGGDVTLGKETEVSVESEGGLRLEECNGNERGMIAIDRNASHSGDSFMVACGEYSLFTMSGATVIERKRQGMNITKAVGFATLTHDQLGSILFTEESGYESSVKFGREFETPKPVSAMLPDWSAEARAQAVMLALNDVLAARKFAGSRERSYVNTSLPGKLDKLMAYPTTTDSVFDFLSGAIEREQFDGATLVKMAGEVENAYAEVTELTPDVINGHASRASMVAEDYDQWHDYFYRLMRPPVEPKHQPLPPVPVPDCPNNKKMKRVDNPPPRKVKSVPAKEEPAQDPEESAEKTDD